MSLEPYMKKEITMRTKILSIGGFSLVLIIYALLYMATSKRTCDDTCEKIGLIDQEIKKGRPFIFSVYGCNDSNLCVVVKDTIPYNWNQLADTACIYLKTQSLFNYKVTILKNNFVDTLGQVQCP